MTPLTDKELLTWPPNADIMRFISSYFGRKLQFGRLSMTYHPFIRSHDYADSNCGECGKPIEHEDHQVLIEEGSETEELLRKRGMLCTTQTLTS